MTAGDQPAAEEPDQGAPAVGMSATGHLDHMRQEIPLALVAILADWTQGMYVRDVPIVWAGPDADDPLFDEGTHTTPSTSRLIETAKPGAAGRFAHTVITSQTCDVVGAGPGARHPHVQVGPVVPLDDDLPDDKIGQIERYEIPYLVPVTQPPGPGGWVVDLRISIPVSKTALADQQRTLAFADDRDVVVFAKHVARKIDRPALHDALSETLPRSIGDWIKQHGKKDVAWWQNVEQLRLRLTGDRLRPQAAALVVLAETQLSVEQEGRWRDWQAAFAKKLLRDHNIVLEPVQFTSMEDMPARQYGDTLWVRVPELKRLPPAF